MNRTTRMILGVRLATLLVCCGGERPAERPVFQDEHEARPFLHCIDDDDCVVVRNDCCEHQDGQIALRKDKRNEFAQRFDCRGVRCRTIAVLGGPPLIARCEQGSCKLAHGQWDGPSDF